MALADRVFGGADAASCAQNAYRGHHPETWHETQMMRKGDCCMQCKLSDVIAPNIWRASLLLLHREMQYLKRAISEPLNCRRRWQPLPP